MNLNIASLVLDSKSMTFEYPGMDGFSVELAYLSKTKIAELRKSCEKVKYDTNLQIPVPSIDEEKWLEVFCKEVIRNWEGFKVKHLVNLILIDEEGLDLEEEVPYNLENAVALLTKSPAFDGWVNSRISDLGNFRNRG